jgi:hypothetical protein
LFHIVNVPTIIWIDERGRICRPHDAQFGTDTFRALTGKSSGVYLDLIRAWVRDGSGALADDEVRAHQLVPTAESQHARAERALAWYLHESGREDAALPHFERAAQLAPQDWTIRRGSLPIRGLDPFGENFFALARDGVPVYPMEDVTPTREA